MKKNKEGTQVAKHKDKKSFKARLSSIIMCAPVTIWSVLFVLVPVGMLLFMSFMTKGPLGKIVYKFTLDNYAEIFKPVYVTVVKQSLLIAVWTTVLTILLGYPTSYRDCSCEEKDFRCSDGASDASFMGQRFGYFV